MYSSSLWLVSKSKAVTSAIYGFRSDLELMEETKADAPPAASAQEILIHRRMQELYDEYHLSPVQRIGAQKFISSTIADPSNLSVTRVREWLLYWINKKKVPPCDPRQRGCPEIIPGLRASPWWDRAEFPWIGELEALYPVIREELLALRNLGGFQPYRGPSYAVGIPSPDIGTQSHDAGDWNVFYLFLHGLSFEENCAKCPRTVEAIKNIIPRHYEHAFFSAVNPGTHILNHWGPTNKKLRLHFSLIGSEGTRLRARDDVGEFEEGRARVFDDSFDHEAWHDGTTTRINLIIDFWHPDLSDEEVKFLSYMQKAKIRAEKKMTANEEDTFYSVIDRARAIRPNDSSWWTLSAEDEAKIRAAEAIDVPPAPDTVVSES